jgi:hypothetical protein
MYTTDLPTWEKTENRLDELSSKFPVGWSYMARVASGRYPADAFSKGQLLSKVWLLHEYKTYTISRMRSEPRTVALLGCWIGTLVEPLLKTDCMIEHVWGFDSDQRAVDQSNDFNQRHVNNHWKYHAVCEDVNAMDWNSPQFEIQGQLIEDRPQLIINTSAEHMSPDWYHSVAPDQLVILQTNNNDTIPGHINTVNDELELRAMYPMSNLLYVGAMVMPDYTRFMMIGYK